ncbi:DNA-binding MarR family transcriptional regulator [Natronocella acetinitrilica]|uniref:DNA-binding MarR family transcriptional regulator n=1 Tax=Natronocella acetinitrilica TaxID=414046 RepID=A0AAE3G1P7_9GAMM|nr:MarR family transcriptional regulator [Natronocella acetinitrilica]MCP1673568.1 DNA-binding MarR family transcriptional regulator [Natronocella acetinitrilica]
MSPTKNSVRKDGAVSVSEETLKLSSRPGFLIRRLHQIHVALFLEECAEFDITPVQYSLLTALRAGEMDQKTLAENIGIDHATTTNVVKRLEVGGWLKRRTGEKDRRRRLVWLTPAGEVLLDRMHGPAQRAHDRTVSHLKPRDRERFVAYLTELVEAGNAFGRAPFNIR